MVLEAEKGSVPSGFFLSFLLLLLLLLPAAFLPGGLVKEGILSLLEGPAGEVGRLEEAGLREREGERGRAR